MLDLSFSVSLGGSSYNDHVVAIRRNHSICEGMATGEIELSTGASLPDPYDEVVIHELGTKVFTGYVVSVIKGRMPLTYLVGIADPSIKLADYWTTDVYTSSGETAEYWIGFFCDLAGVSYQFDVSYNRIVPGGDDAYEWQYSSAFEIIRELLVVGGFYMWSDPDGVIHFSDMNTGTNDSGTEVLSIRREQNTDNTRNKAIVFGRYPIVAEATVTIPELSDRQKIAVVATPFVETSGYAQNLANRMIAHFSSITDVKFLEIIGNPSIRVGQTIHYEDSWMGLDDYGLVVKYSSEMTNDGYTGSLVLDEFCPYIWGYDKHKGLYLSTDGSGVYFFDFHKWAWESRSSGLVGDALHVRAMALNPDHYGTPDVNHELFIATMSGVFMTSNGGRVWSGVALPNPSTPSATMSGMDYYDLVYGNQDSNKVWVLTSNGSGVWVYGTVDGGGSWNSRGVTVTGSGI